MDSLTSPGKWGVGLFDLSERVTAAWQSKDFDDDGYGGSEEHFPNHFQSMLHQNKSSCKDDEFGQLEKEINHLTLNNEIHENSITSIVNDEKNLEFFDLSKSTLQSSNSYINDNVSFSSKLISKKKLIKKPQFPLFNQMNQLPPSMRLSKEVKATVMEELNKCRLNVAMGFMDGENCENGKERVCKFCLNNREDPEIYSCHVVKDQYGNVICPILKVYKCPLCGATGNNAHTVTYCPNYKNSIFSNINVNKSLDLSSFHMNGPNVLPVGGRFVDDRFSSNVLNGFAPNPIGIPSFQYLCPKSTDTTHMQDFSYNHFENH